MQNQRPNCGSPRGAIKRSAHTRMSGAGRWRATSDLLDLTHQSCCPSSHLGCSRHATSTPAQGAPGRRHRVHIPRSLRITMQVTQTMKYVYAQTQPPTKHNRSLGQTKAPTHHDQPLPSLHTATAQHLPTTGDKQLDVADRPGDPCAAEPQQPESCCSCNAACGVLRHSDTSHSATKTAHSQLPHTAPSISLLTHSGSEPFHLRAV